MEVWLNGEIYGHCRQCGASLSAATKKKLLSPCECGGKIILCSEGIEENTYTAGYAHACGYRD